MMNKKNITRAAMLFLSFVIVILLAYGCTMMKGDVTDPKLSNPDVVYLNGSDFEVTNLDLYEQMKPYEGVRFLLDIMDSYLVSSYLEQVDSDDINKEILLFKYGTDNQDEIDAYDEETLELLEENYNEKLLIAGYDYENVDDINEFMSLRVAKKDYARDLIVSSVEGDTNFISKNMKESYYDESVFNDVCALTIKFNSETEAKNILEFFNLVSYESNLREYTGDTPLSELSSNLLDDTNTKELTEDEIFTYYIKIYNYMYSGYRPSLDESLTKEELCQSDSEFFTHNYEEMNKENSQLASYIFKTLDLNKEDVTPYSYQTKKFTSQTSDVSTYYLVYKVTQPEKVEFLSLSVDKIEEITDILVEEKLNSNGFIDNALKDARNESNFEIFDRYLALNYAANIDTTYDFSNMGHKTIVAKIDDLEVTADDLFNKMSSRAGTLHSVEVAKEKKLLQSSFYKAVYGDNYDYIKNASEKMREHRNEFRDLKLEFSRGAFYQYGYSPDVYKWEEFLYVIAGAKSESEAIKKLYVNSQLIPYYVYPEIEYDEFSDKIDELYNNYFSLNAVQLLILLDYDEDGSPDDYNDYFENLTSEEQSTLTALIAKFETEIGSYLDSDKTMQDLVGEYNDALRGEDENEADYSKWAEFKNYGLFLKYEDLSKDGSLDYQTTQNFVKEFVDALQRIYDEYSRPENISESEFLDNTLVQSQFGLHLILASKGTNFTKPSAKFTEDTNESYTVGSVNENDYPTKEQVLLYLERNYYDKIYGTLEDLDVTVPSIPLNVEKAIDTYFGSMHNTLYSIENLTYLITSELLTEGVTYTNNDAEQQVKLEVIKDLFYDKVYN